MLLEQIDTNKTYFHAQFNVIKSILKKLFLKIFKYSCIVFDRGKLKSSTSKSILEHSLPWATTEKIICRGLYKQAPSGYDLNKLKHPCNIDYAYIKSLSTYIKMNC